MQQQGLQKRRTEAQACLRSERCSCRRGQRLVVLPSRTAPVEGRALICSHAGKAEGWEPVTRPLCVIGDVRQVQDALRPSIVPMCWGERWLWRTRVSLVSVLVPKLGLLVAGVAGGTPAQQQAHLVAWQSEHWLCPGACANDWGHVGLQATSARERLAVTSRPGPARLIKRDRDTAWA